MPRHKAVKSPKSPNQVSKVSKKRIRKTKKTLRNKDAKPVEMVTPEEATTPIESSPVEIRTRGLEANESVSVEVLVSKIATAKMLFDKYHINAKIVEKNMKLYVENLDDSHI